MSNLKNILKAMATGESREAGPRVPKRTTSPFMVTVRVPILPMGDGVNPEEVAQSIGVTIADWGLRKARMVYQGPVAVTSEPVPDPVAAALREMRETSPSTPEAIAEQLKQRGIERVIPIDTDMLAQDDLTMFKVIGKEAAQASASPKAEPPKPLPGFYL